ncbi:MULTISPECIES: hypothetical protein [unclassified Novosphingobium]|uniref:hypothetical protein n=1 Tax=unclassified Novosphingobium TaxID=2644732 RepID=UPI00135AB1EA|nr:MULTISPECIES: hypothetical protein [unclassified Novosphingobium]
MLEAHRSPTSMARVLVQYIDDPERVRRAVLGEFNWAPTIQTIRLMRADYLRPGPAPICWKLQSNAYAESMERANRDFMRAVAATYPNLIRKAA